MYKLRNYSGCIVNITVCGCEELSDAAIQKETLQLVQEGLDCFAAARKDEGSGQLRTWQGINMSEKILRLSPRLAVVAGFIDRGSDVADIGTDHGYLPAYLALYGLARRIIASDKSAGSLGAALRTASKYGVSDKITFIAASGLDGVDLSQIDTVVIAGVGGETIISILEDAPWTKRPGMKLILQPQTKLDKLCDWLNGNGYAITDKKLAHEKKRVYTVLVVGET